MTYDLWAQDGWINGGYVPMPTRSVRLFGMPFRSVRRPILLIVVLGIFLTIVGMTAFSQAVIVSSQTSATMLNAVVGSDAATVRGFANGYLVPADLGPGGLSPTRAAALQAQVRTIVAAGQILRIELRLPDGTVLLSDATGLTGTRGAMTPDFLSATQGTVTAGFHPVGEAESMGPILPVNDILRAYFPVKVDGRVVAVVGIWRDAAPILGDLDRLRRDVTIVTLFAAALAAIALYLVFRAAQVRILRQTDELIESTTLDPMTGVLNHGALVGVLALAIEAAHQTDETLDIALLDIDNFRSLNETYGHPAGDRALTAVALLLRDTLPADARWGRYGPDEFLVIVTPDLMTDLEATVGLVRTRLADLSLRFGSSEQLPITISAGICSFPINGESVTTLLSIASRTLDEAKVSGGDGVRVAQVDSVPLAEAVRFDVLEGLIIAVDTKDHYTRRHSEDVARYAAFLAERLGLDEQARSVVYRAGRLHDIGKIGVPDRILRKPAALTEQEYETVKQHVALGDLLVRDLPNLEEIRAGIRHHHERWDGTGYLEHLAGTEIPEIARILAVCDAFSAMTSTRPYRKAMSLDEALTRLEDAAGSQLDERLVIAFVAGIRTVATAPLPGDGRGGLWRPGDPAVSTGRAVA
jgi:diguanylate cyclase (GGDEF)-like protein